MQGMADSAPANDYKAKMVRDFMSTVRWQLLAGLVISGLALQLSGLNAAISVLLGVAVVLLGTAGAVWMTRPSSLSPTAALVNLLKAEVLKILIVAVLLFVVFKVYAGLVAVALIGGLACAALVSSVALRSFDNGKKA